MYEQSVSHTSLSYVYIQYIFHSTEFVILLFYQKYILYHSQQHQNMISRRELLIRETL